MVFSSTWLGEMQYPFAYKVIIAAKSAKNSVVTIRMRNKWAGEWNV